jgi:hypothetical protein
MRIIDTSRLFVVAAAALAIVSCTRDSGGPAGSSVGDNASAASSGATPAAATPSTAVKAPPALLVPSGGAQAAPTPTLGIEAPATPPSPQVLQAVSAAQAKLDGLTAGVAGTRVRFVDCSETASCTARVEAQSLAELRDLLQSMSGPQGGIGFVAREQLDAYSGRTFVADVALAGATPRAVPTDENELLDN